MSTAFDSEQAAQSGGTPRRPSSPRPISPRLSSPRQRDGSSTPRQQQNSPRPVRPGFREAGDSFAISAELYDELSTRTTPLPAGKRYMPSRRVLLAVHAATHGEGCLLKQRNHMIDATQRGKVLVDLWRKLTADETTASEKILAEAHAAQRKHANVRTPSPSYRRWLAAPPSSASGAGGAGFGSTVERLHPVERAGLTDSTLASPGVGAYNPEQVASKASRGSTWSRLPSSVSRLKKDSENESDKGHRPLYDEATAASVPGMGAYRTSSRDMSKEILKKAAHPSPGMARPTSASRLQGLHQQKAQPGPGSYDLGGFNISRRDHSRPSSAFKSRTPRESPFGAAGKSPMLAAGMAALEGLGGPSPRSPGGAMARGRGL
jgi:hypothetical protein